MSRSLSTFFVLVVAGGSAGGGRLVLGPLRFGALGVADAGAGIEGAAGAEDLFTISPIPSKSISNSSKSMSLSSANISSKSKLSKAAASTDGAAAPSSPPDELRLVRAIGGMIKITIGLS